MCYSCDIHTSRTTPSKPTPSIYKTSLALATYRTGDARKALNYIQRSEDSNPGPHAHALNLAARALAQMDLGKIAEAHADAEMASHAIDALSIDGISYYDMLMARILLEEAKTNLKAVK